jgi:hypothetical protein
MPKKNSKSESADVHEELSGFDIKIDEFGKMSFNYSIDKLNDFLNKNTQDKKLSISSEEEE